MSDTWVWEYVNTGNGQVYTSGEYESEEAVRRMIRKCFTDCHLKPGQRRGVPGVIVMVGRHGNYEDTGHWIYAKRDAREPLRDARLLVAEWVDRIIDMPDALEDYEDDFTTRELRDAFIQALRRVQRELRAAAKSE